MAQETQTSITQIRKRDGRVVQFDKEKIANAIFRAAKEVGGSDKNEADRLASIVVSNLESKFANNDKIPSVEEVQDIVEKVLIEDGHAKTAKAYIIYRHKHAEIRRTKELLGVNDDLKLPVNTIKVLASRYLIKDENGKIIETPRELFWRAARNVAAADKLYGKTDEDVEATAKEFYEMITSSEFMPNSPTLMNAGTRLGQLSACFVIPVGDSIEEIFDAVKHQAIIHKTGGGTGFAFSRLRPKGDRVRGTFGVSSGPVSFMKIFDAATAEVKQGGKRRGANMGILRIDHPDILEFIMMKEREGVLANFNISCAITDKFIHAMRNNEDYELINPRNNIVAGKLNARAIWNLIVTMAWKTGDPGVIFIDRINNTVSNPVPSLGPVESTNPCVTGDTRLATSFGLVRMDDLVNMNQPFKVVSDYRGVDYSTKGIISRESSPAFITSESEDVYKITTKHGYEIKVTSYHKFITPEGRKSLKDLKKGDKLFIQSEEGMFGKEGTPELGLLMGMISGDGWFTDDRGASIGLWGDDMQDLSSMIMDAISSVIESESPSFVDVPSRNMSMLRSKKLASVLSKYGFNKLTKRIVPEIIWRGTKETVVKYLQGLFTCDGTVNVSSHKKSCSVRLCQSNIDFLKQIQILLSNFGVESKILLRKEAGRKKFGKKYYHCVKYYELIIDGGSRDVFAQKIGFLSKMKQEKLISFIQNKSRKSNSSKFETEIESVEYLGKQKVYDVTEPVTHTVSFNGIITAQCGEQPLYPYDSCNLGSINLGKMVKDGEVDWEKLRATVRMCVHFLDNVIDANKYPLIEIELMSKKVRRIGLGVMGFADMLILLGIPYNSPYALKVAESVMKFISDEGRQMSVELAKERGSFPEFKNSVWSKMGYEAMRNSTVTTIAPTGTISIIAGGCSQGIEPLFSIAYLRAVGGSLGHDLVEVSPLFERIAIQEGFYSEDLIKKISQLPSIQDVQEIPADVRRLFVTAFDLLPEWHVRIQAAFQKYTDNAVSKTINFPNSATPYDVEKAYMLAYDLACKGITIYRDGSKSFQVLNVGGKPQEVSVPIGESGMIEYRENCEGCNM